MENITFDHEITCISPSIESDMGIAATEEIENAPKAHRMVSLLKVDVDSGEKDEKQFEDLCLEYAQLLYRCTLCSVESSMFSTKETLLKHFKENHHLSSKNTIVCYKCSIKLKSQTDYENHQIQKHVSSKIEKRFGDNELEIKELASSFTDEDLSPTYSTSSLTDCNYAAQQKLTNKRKSSTPIKQKPGEELDSFHDIIKEKLKPTLAGDCKKDDIKRKEHLEKNENTQDDQHKSDQVKPYNPVWAEGGKKVIVKEEPLAGMTDSPLALLKSLKMAPDDLSKEMLPFPYPGIILLVNVQENSTLK